MQNEIVISYVMTVFNKEPYIGYTVESLLTQQGNIPSEYIFVDDVSSDRSVEIVEERTRGIPNVTIVRNTTNCGPSTRVNHGARLAQGKYLLFIDSDDILAANASRLMLALMEKYEADVVHGGWEKTGIESAKLLGRCADDTAPHVVSDDPLNLLFTERVHRMSQMVRRDTFLKAGGCDERVFVQDESLALRLARVSKRFVLLKTPILLIPKLEGELSRNVSQCNHDRFLAQRNLLMDFPDLPEDIRRKLYRKCISAVWKQHQRDYGWKAYFTKAFLNYVHSRLQYWPVDEAEVQRMTAYFAGIKGVRYGYAAKR